MTERELFIAALQCDDAGQRAALLDRECRDPAVRLRVERLLQAHNQAGDFLEAKPNGIVATADFSPAPDAAAMGRTEDLTGERIGPYRLQQKLGEGGMGSVWLAEQSEPVRRQVALKVIKAGMDTALVIARFEAERQALALMDHPNIARIIDAGTTAERRPYFVMELVKGMSITKYCDYAHLNPTERLELFIPVCQAVQHAHQKGIIHRDLKPSNVIVGLYDGRPVSKIIDFGVAKATRQRLTERTMFTEVGNIIGTLEYMAPEQAELNNLDIDTRVDIYSLGVILYELLAGSPPFSSQQLRGAAFTEMLRVIREVEPPKPSTKLSASDELPNIAANRSSEPKRLAKTMHGELDWIVMKCLEKDRGRRYETANGLALELQRFLHGEPVLAGPPGVSYRLSKFVRKHRLWLSMASAIALLLAVSTAVSTWQAVRASRAEQVAVAARAEEVRHRQDALDQRDRAVAAEERAKAEEKQAKTSAAEANAVLTFFQDRVLAAARPKDQEGGLGIDVTIRAAVDAAAPRIGVVLADKPLVEASLRDVLGETYRYLGEPNLAVAQQQRAFELRKSQLGAEHDDTLKSQSNLALAYQKAGRFPEAIDLFQQVRSARREKLGVDAEATIRATTLLASAYVPAGRTDEAIALFEEALKLTRACYPTNHVLTLDCVHELAQAYHRGGRAKDAAPLYEEAFQYAKAKNGLEHPETAMVLSNLALVRHELGHTAEAIPLFEQAAALTQKCVGPHHPDTLRCQNNLAMAYGLMGRMVESAPLLESILKARTVKLGRDHPETLYSLNNLGLCFLQIGRAAEALPLLEEAVTLRTAKLGADHSETLGSRSNFASALEALGRAVEALPIYEQMLKVRREKFGAEHPDTINNLHNLGHSYLVARRLDEALATYEEAVRICIKVHGVDHPLTMITTTNLARVHDARGKYDVAQPLYDQVLAGLRPRFGPDHPQIATVLLHFGRNQLGLNQPASAEQKFREALSILEKKAPNGWPLFYTQSLVGNSLVRQAKYAEAEPLLRAGFEGMTERADKIPPPERIRRAEAAENLVKLYEVWNKPDEAAKWRKELEAITNKIAAKP